MGAEPETDPPITPAGAPLPVYQPTTGGARLRWIAFIAGVAGVALGAIGVRSTIRLGGRIDPDLVTTPELAMFGLVGAVAVAVVTASLAIGAIAGRRWARRMHASLTALGDGAAPFDAARTTSRIATGLALVGALFASTSVLPLVLPAGRDLARALWATTAIGGFLLPISAALLIWLIGDVERREALAIHARHSWQPAPGPRDRRWPLPAIAILATVAVVPLSLDAPDPWVDEVCRAAEVECRWMIVQADQLANDPRGATRELHYGLRRATKQREGTLVIASGGPGVSGIGAFAQSAGRLDERLTDAYDVVVFDPRGVGGSGYVDCPAASLQYRASLSFDSVAAVIEDFVDACLGETGVDRARLAEYGSDHLVEDIEAIRRDLGVDRIALYGESYGTVVAQRYAAAHPDRLEALILDGPIDIAQPADASWAEASRGFEDVLERSLRTCPTSDGCEFHPHSVWDNVMRSLEPGDVTASYADVDGEVIDWPLTPAVVRETLTSAMYDVTGRMLAMRALSAAEDGDWVPLARLVYSGIDFLYPQTTSDFAYHAAWCADRYESPPYRDAATFLAETKRSEFATSRLGTVYLSSAACHAWPVRPSDAPPVTVPPAATYPVLVLTATGDPITPPAHGERIAARYRALTDTYVVETSEGPHVTFGRGRPCPDDVVVELLVGDERPSAETTCTNILVAPFIGFASPSSTRDALEYRAQALDLEIYAHPEYVSWDGGMPLTIGCRFGGTVNVSAGESDAGPEHRLQIDGCAVLRGEPATGTGAYRGSEEAELEVTLPNGRLTYRVVGPGRYTMAEDVSAVWRGTLDGRAIEGSR